MGLFYREKANRSEFANLYTRGSHELRTMKATASPEALKYLDKLYCEGFSDYVEIDCCLPIGHPYLPPQISSILVFFTVPTTHTCLY